MEIAHINPAGENSSSNTFSGNKAILLVLIAAIVVLAGGIVYLLTRTQSSSPSQVQQAVGGSVSGTFNINGVVPQGATITLSQKEFRSEDAPKAFMEGIVPLDGAAWSFNEGTLGKTYEIQASIVQNGATISQSNTITVTAPATQEQLTMNVESTSGSSAANAIISGNIEVNGYVPVGSTITIQGRKLGTTKFNTVAQALPGKARQYLSYTTAVAGTTYEVQGVLTSATGTLLGTSSTLVVTAPALNEVLMINSSATQPAVPTPTPQPTSSQATVVPSTPTPVPAPAIISGSINFNGQAPANSRIAIFQKVYNTSSYQLAVDNITPVNGAAWQWNNPQASTWYDLIAILKQRQPNGSDMDISDSQVVSVAAPAGNVVFNVNSGFSLAAPGGPINVTCGNVSGNTWNAQLSLGAVQNAQTYWIEVGTTNGGTQLMNQTQGAQNNNGQAQTLNVSLNRNTTYYVAYAYSNVANQSSGSNQFSPFSNTTQINCN